MDASSATMMRSRFLEIILFLPGFLSSNTESMTFKNHLCHLYCNINKWYNHFFSLHPSSFSHFVLVFYQVLHTILSLLRDVDHRHLFLAFLIREHLSSITDFYQRINILGHISAYEMT